MLCTDKRDDLHFNEPSFLKQNGLIRGYSRPCPGNNNFQIRKRLKGLTFSEIPNRSETRCLLFPFDTLYFTQKKSVGQRKRRKIFLII